MALGELGSYIASIVLAVVVYRKTPFENPGWKFFFAFLVFAFASKTLHWFVHLGYRPENNEE
jgi:hypothetical protein